MDDGAGPGWCHGVGVPIVFCAVELFVGGDVRIDVGLPENIASDCCLVCQVVPQLEWKLWVCCAHAADEVIFEGLNGPLGCIDAVIVWFDELHIAVVGLHKCFDWGRCLIVGDIENGLVTFVCKHVMDLFECCHYVTF